LKNTFESGRSSIERSDDEVIRPTGPWSLSVHKYLDFLDQQAFQHVPIPLGIDGDGREHLSYVDGQVYSSMEIPESRSDEMLVSLAHFLKAFHDLGRDYLCKLSTSDLWMLPMRQPVETMCHGDLGPYNVVTQGNTVKGLIDFDTLHPGPIMWDLAYALYRWVPLMHKGNPEDFGDRDNKLRRIKLFMTAYGKADQPLETIYTWVLQRIEYLMIYMENEGAKGNEAVALAIERGDLNLYKRDLAYIEALRNNVIIT